MTKTKITNIGGQAWGTCFDIPAGESLVLSDEQHELFRQNYPTFVQATFDDQLAIELVDVDQLDSPSGG